MSDWRFRRACSGAVFQRPNVHYPASYHRGVALILVLWFVVLLSVLALGLSKVSRNGALTARQLSGATQARYLAEGGVQLVLANLLLAREEERLLGDGEAFELLFKQGAVQARLWDESGKVDINGASEALLTRLLQALGLSPPRSEELAAAIADWRDEDDLKRLYGAEDEDYLAAGIDAGAGDRAFRHIVELRQVLGMDEKLYQKMEAYVTVHSKNSGINPRVAPLLILLAVADIDEKTATLEHYVEERRRTYLAGLPAPPAPPIPEEFLAETRATVLSLSAEATTLQNISAGSHLVFELVGNEEQLRIKKLYSQPYALQVNRLNTAIGDKVGEH